MSSVYDSNYAPDLSNEERASRRESMELRVGELGIKIDIKDPLKVPAATIAAGVAWTCATLQQAADYFLVQSLLTTDPTIFMAYSSASAIFQDAHDGQCTSP